MKSDWMIEHLYKDGKLKYGVYRLNDISLADTAENREYIGFYDDHNTAFFTAADLNIEAELSGSED